MTVLDTLLDAFHNDQPRGFHGRWVKDGSKDTLELHSDHGGADALIGHVKGSGSSWRATSASETDGKPEFSAPHKTAEDATASLMAWHRKDVPANWNERAVRVVGGGPKGGEAKRKEAEVAAAATTGRDASSTNRRPEPAERQDRSGKPISVVVRVGSSGSASGSLPGRARVQEGRLGLLLEDFNPGELRGFHGEWIRSKITPVHVPDRQVTVPRASASDLKREQELSGGAAHWVGDKVHVVTPQGHVQNGLVQSPAQTYNATTSRGTERSTTIGVKWDDGDVTHERPQDVSPGHRSGRAPGDPFTSSPAPADRHGGFKVGDVVRYSTGSRAGGHGPVTMTQQPGLHTVVGLQRNGNLRVKHPDTGATVDVPHAQATKVSPLDPAYRGKVVQDAYAAQRSVLAGEKAQRARGSRLAESGVGVLLEAFAPPVAGLETPAQSQARGAAQAAAAQRSLAAGWTAAKHPRAAGGRFGYTTGGKRATRSSAATQRTVGQGAQGALVRSIQKQLGLPTDGVFGPNTKAAVVRFQQQHRLQVDGVVGAQTLAALRGNPNARSIAPGPIRSRAAAVKVHPSKRAKRGKVDRYGGGTLV